MAVLRGPLVAACVFVGGFSSACGSPAQLAEPSQRKVAGGSASAPIPEQTSYCTRLQPLLNQAVKAAQVGSELACLDIPGVTELGRYGPPTAAEEDALANCFDSGEAYAALVSHPE